MAGAPTPAASLVDRIEGLEGLTAGRSRFSDRPAWWAGDTEVAHFHGDVLDVRLTLPVIRARRPELAAAGVRFRGATSEWISLGIATPADADRGLALVADAVAAHRSPG